MTEGHRPKVGGPAGGPPSQGSGQNRPEDVGAVDYVARSLAGFRADPPDSDYQKGFLAALLVVWREGLGKGAKDKSLNDLAAMVAAPAVPIQMILHCPRCGLQHVDEPDERTPGWTNPPHRSHLCHGCGCIWRPADCPTTGVAALYTSGTADSWPASAWPGEDGTLARRRSWIADEQAALEAYLAAYALTTEGADYEPTEFERGLLHDALQGWLVVQDDLLANRLGHRLFMEHDRHQATPGDDG